MREPAPSVPTIAELNLPDRGAWYAAFEIRTAQAEIAFHKMLHLAEIGRFEDDVTFDDYLADFSCELHDLRGEGAFVSCLDPSSYIPSQTLAAELMDAGSLVSDEIMIGIVAERLERRDASTRGYLLDGFPRTVPQAKALGELTDERPVHVVIDLDVPRELVLDRLSRRRVCNVCQTNYVATGLERPPWICDNCGGDVVQRDDDTPEAINHRLDLYESQTSPLIDHYDDAGTLAVVNGVGHPDYVFRRIVDTVERRRKGREGI